MGQAAPIQAAVDALPIDTIVGEYVSEMRRQGRRDARNEERIIRRVSRGCGWRTLVDVTAASVRAYLQDAHARGLSASSANNTLSALVGLVDFLIQTGRASENWAKAIPRSRGERGDGARALTLAEVARLIEVARLADAHRERLHRRRAAATGGGTGAAAPTRGNPRKCNRQGFSDQAACTLGPMGVWFGR